MSEAKKKKPSVPKPQTVKKTASRKATAKGEGEYQVLLENLRAGVYRVTGDGQWIHANSAMITLFGYDSMKELAKIPVADLYENKEDRLRFIEEVRRSGSARARELRLKKKDGTPFWAACTASVQYGENGGVRFIEGIIEDITDRKNAEKALRESEEDHRTLLENLRAGVYRVSGDGRFILANSAMIALFGFESMEDLRSATVSDLYVHQEDRIRFVEQVRRTGNAKGTVLRLKKKDGTPFWAACTAAIRYGKDGAIRYFEGIIEDITERKNTEAALRESEKAHRTLLENLRAGVYRVSGDGRWIHANSAMIALFGFDSFKELARIPVADLYEFPEDRLRFIEEVRRTGSARGRELRLKKKGGTPFWGACTASVRTDDSGEIQYIEGIIEDITERRKAEASLRKSEEEHRTLLENLRSGVYRVTADGKWIHANTAMITLFGYDSMQELAKVPVADLYENKEDRLRFIEEVRRTGSARGKELRLRKRDGTPFWGACTASVRADTAGSIQYIEGIIEDVTDRKVAEEALQRSNEILNNILSASPVGIGLLENDVIQWANSEMIDMFGFEGESDCRGKSISTIYMSDVEYQRVLETIKENLRCGRPVEVDARYRRKGGQTFTGHFKMSCPDPGNPSKRAIFTIHDISWRLQAEEERLQKEKLRGVLEMAGAVCHEMNQPLQGIMGYADIAMLSMGKDEPFYDKMKKIADLAANIGRITNKLQHITKYETKDYIQGKKIIDIDRAITE